MSYRSTHPDPDQRRADDEYLDQCHDAVEAAEDRHAAVTRQLAARKAELQRTRTSAAADERVLELNIEARTAQRAVDKAKRHLEQVAADIERDAAIHRLSLEVHPTEAAAILGEARAVR